MKNTQAVCVALLAAVLLGSVGIVVSVAARQQKNSNAIRVQTDLVGILASVIDAKGEPVPDLTQDSFSLSEDGVPQTIARFEPETNRPLDLALMVDSSMSALKDIKFETEAAAHFIRQVVRPGDTLAVFEFSESVSELSEFSDDVPRLQSAVRRIAPGSGTSMYDAVVLASNALKRRPAERRRAIVLVTDAGETTSYSKFDDTRRAAIASQALLYSIIIRPVQNEGGRNTAGEHALITITDSTGGALFVVDSPAQLDGTFDRIDRELRTQYLLGYYPNPVPPPGSDRHVELKVKTGDLVRYRKEYFTAGKPE
ncbi:MAG TPA: VWA domain-containing protein [Candidatus Acidoferrales bacterium]|nr:VWA domain-containing protein [Candidatus Acidoferrales bacterium]